MRLRNPVEDASGASRGESAWFIPLTVLGFRLVIDVSIPNHHKRARAIRRSEFSMTATLAARAALRAAGDWGLGIRGWRFASRPGYWRSALRAGGHLWARHQVKAE